MRLPGRRLVGTDEIRSCGCCGRDLPVTAVHELGATPGVYICRRCGLWAATRIGRR
ncbi:MULTISPECIES: hypothetical protein [Blastococcus]|uniref:hypothetical protein n=1 Tax=Blastococcus TaxID=38501 RepID=UPI0013DFB0FA|nr:MULTISPECIES: hypothetical protein [Blastococcus]